MHRIMLFAPNGHFKFDFSLGGVPPASAQGKPTSLMENAAVTLGEDPPINPERTPGVAGKSAARLFLVLTIRCSIIILGPRFLLTVKMWISLSVNIM